MHKGQVVYKPSLFCQDRYKKQDKLLFEVIVSKGDKNIHLYYIDATYEIINGKIKLIDEKAGISFLEDENTEINVYDAYSIEFISTDYEIDYEILSMSRYIIHANRQIIPVLKVVKRRMYQTNMSYDYYSVREKEAQK